MEEKLPEKPSDLIELALEDMIKVLDDDEYKIYMYIWHNFHKDIGKCLICFAGAVIAKTLNVDKKASVIPSSFDSHTKARLFALDSFRAGHLSAGLCHMNYDWNSDYDYVYVPAYDNANPEPFFEAMRKIIDLFRRHGI